MNILYVSGGEVPDYQCDMLFHGMRSQFGPQVVDANRIPHMYRSDVPDGSLKKAALYGKGFTLFGLLDNDDAVDRQDLGGKIAALYFDLVIYGSIRRCQSFIHEVLEHYPSDRIVFIDGEDDQLIVAPILGRGHYFKRELNAPRPLVAPIQFAVPAEKLATVATDKLRIQARIDPRDRATYVYATEPDYYRDYAESLFGFTMKKAGWDCLRHYEIMANGCIPNFEGLEACPPSTMTFLPKFELVEARNGLLTRGPDYFKYGEGRGAWERLEARIGRIMRRHLTTTALAGYVIETVRRQDHRTLMM